MSAPAPHKIVIVGGNFGGIRATHLLLRQTIPTLRKLDKSKQYHVTLITPNTHFFFKIASPRALINSTLIPQDKILKPLTQAFSQYDANCFTLVTGYASELDAAGHIVTVTSGAETTKIEYDSLIIATGTTSASPLWTLHNDQSLTTGALKAMHAALPKAKTVLIAGGGAVGVETAGEIASAFPGIKVTLLSGANRLLTRAKPATGARAQEYLSKLKVEVIHDIRVQSADPAGPSTEPTTLTLSNGKEKKVDIYIDATGGVPNSQFLPVSWLDETKRVIAGDKYYRVRGAAVGDKDAKGIYVVGDIVAGSSNTLMHLDPMVDVAVSSLAVDIAGTLGVKKPEPAKTGFLSSLLKMFFGGEKSTYPAQQEFKGMEGTMIVPIGPNGGVGQLMGWKAPNFMVKMVKAKSFFVETVPGTLTAEKIEKIY